MYQYRAEVLGIVDGDTLRLDVDLGFHTHIVTTLRIDGINAPELRADDPKPGQKAMLQLHKFLPNGSPVVITTRKARQFDKYGRLLATVTDADGTNIGDRMINTGNAVFYDGGKREG